MWCTTSLTFNNCTLCPHCIYVFCIYPRTNSDLCHLQHKLIDFYNPDDKCLQLGTDWVFKYSGLRLVFRGLTGDKQTSVLCVVQIWESIYGKGRTYCYVTHCIWALKTLGRKMPLPTPSFPAGTVGPSLVITAIRTLKLTAILNLVTRVICGG